MSMPKKITEHCQKIQAAIEEIESPRLTHPPELKLFLCIYLREPEYRFCNLVSVKLRLINVSDKYALA